MLIGLKHFSEFNYEIVYQKGTAHKNAKYLTIDKYKDLKQFLTTITFMDGT